MGNAVKTKKKMPIFKWVLTIFFGLCTLVYFPSVASVLFAVVTFMLCPVQKIQSICNRIWPKNRLRTIFVTVVAFVGIMISPTDDVATEPVDSNSAIVASSAVELPSTESLTAESAGVESLSVAETSADEKVTEESEQSEQVFTGESFFEVHYIDVGQGDSALVLCDDAAMLIDGGTSDNSSLLYSYLQTHDVETLNCIVASHPHEDHVGGLAGALNKATTQKVLCSVASYDSEEFNDFQKYVTKQGLSIEVPKAGDSFSLGSAVVDILGVNLAGDENNRSIVLKVTYGSTSFLFTGDVTADSEQVLLDSGCDLNSTVLKVGHHGGSKGTTEAFLSKVMPEYAVISAGDDNVYKHPANEVLNRLKVAKVTTYRTDMQGDIICVSDGSKVTVSVEKNADVDTLQVREEKTAESSTSNVVENNGGNNNSGNNGTGSTSGSSTGGASSNSGISSNSGNSDNSGGNTEIGKNDTGTVNSVIRTYVLNTNTKKFHYESCSSVKQIKDKNKAFHTGTREECIGMGYDPCGRCHP